MCSSPTLSDTRSGSKSSPATLSRRTAGGVRASITTASVYAKPSCGVTSGCCVPSVDVEHPHAVQRRCFFDALHCQQRRRARNDDRIERIGARRIEQPALTPRHEQPIGAVVQRRDAGEATTRRRRVAQVARCPERAVPARPRSNPDSRTSVDRDRRSSPYRSRRALRRDATPAVDGRMLTSMRPSGSSCGSTN